MTYRWVDPISRFKSSPAHAVPDVHDTDIVTSLCGKLINLQFAVPAADGPVIFPLPISSLLGS